MKLGTTTNSLTNYLLSGTNGQPIPALEMGATMLHWTDRTACTIVMVGGSGKRIGVTRDKVTRIDSNGMSEDQDYAYETDRGATVEYFTLRKIGAWVKEGETMNGGTRIRIGDRRHYHDFSF
jgi:hypothetical protein